MTASRSVVFDVILLCFLLSVLAGSSYGWPSDIPKPSDPTVEAKVDYIWENVIGPTVTGGGRGSFNTFFDILHASAAMGTFQVCIRWDSDSVLSSTQRDKMESMLNRMMGQWTSKLKGYDGWPWDTIPVRISGWAGYRESNFEWTESDNGVPVYIGDVSFENAPQCSQACGRFFHTDRDYTYPNCPGGAENHYDFSSWHSDPSKMDGMGFGSDWGQRTLANATISGMDGHMGIMLHEMGHGYYLPDFYDVSVPGGNPSCVMNAGSAMEVTPYDEWMLKRVYSELKRIPGRLPEIEITSTVSPKHVAYRHTFLVSSTDGRIRIKTLNNTSRQFQVSVYDQSGRSSMPSHRFEGNNVLLSRCFARGMYLVNITSGNLNEVHRVNIFY